MFQTSIIISSSLVWHSGFIKTLRLQNGRYLSIVAAATFSTIDSAHIAASKSGVELSKIGQTKLLIDGKFVDSQSGNTFPTLNPADESIISDVAEADKADVDIAVRAARKAGIAFDVGHWAKMGGRERGRAMLRLVDLIKQLSEELAHLECLDNGKPLASARGDVMWTWDHFLYYAGWADKINGKPPPSGAKSLLFQTIPVNSNSLAHTLHEPIGVVGAIIPWNVPMLMAACKMAPALATGNTVVLKAAEQTPLSVLRLGELILEAGIPEGVANILNEYGETAGAALASHMDVDKLAFTGSIEAGQSVMEAAAKSNLKSATLELGRKTAAIVFDDANLDEAIEHAHSGLSFNMGQACCAGSRLMVVLAIQYMKTSRTCRSSMMMSKEAAVVGTVPYNNEKTVI